MVTPAQRPVTASERTLVPDRSGVLPGLPARLACRLLVMAASAAARVPLRIAKARGLPAIKIGSVSARCSATSKPGSIACVSMAFTLS